MLHPESILSYSYQSLTSFLTTRKMGLKNVPGIRYALNTEQQNRNGTGTNQNLNKRAAPQTVIDDKGLSRRLRHQ